MVSAGMQNGSAAVGNSFAVPSKAKYRVTRWLQNCTLQYVLREENMSTSHLHYKYSQSVYKKYPNMQSIKCPSTDNWLIKCDIGQFNSVLFNYLEWGNGPCCNIKKVHQHFEMPTISKIHTGRKCFDGCQELWEEGNRGYANITAIWIMKWSFVTNPLYRIHNAGCTTELLRKTSLNKMTH